ncbi:unnamed protein product [Sphagnum troendelagicum]|uniref:DUF7748 domain-containing protein n=1 Tax=Sphagnum troendelagicum TaxID=128251 RepID=A0ABP0UD31_9BRYO
MGKLETKLINDTRKTLVLYEEASNAAQTRICVLQRPNEQPAAVLETNPDTKRTNVAGEPSFYVHSVDPNDSYSTLRVWCGKKAVFGVSTDEMLDNDVITIRQEDNAFIKHCKPRTQKKEAASPKADTSASPKADASASTPEGDTVASTPESEVAAPTPEGDARKKQKEQNTLEVDPPKEQKEQTTSSPLGNLFKRMGNFFKTH